VDPPEVAVDERVPGLGLVAGAVGEAEMPPGVFVPGVPFQVVVLVAGAGLYLPPVAVEHVLTAVDQPLGLRHRVRVDRIRSHDSILAGRRSYRPPGRPTARPPGRRKAARVACRL